MTAVPSPFSPGLEGIVAAQTAISSVDGEIGELVVRGFTRELERHTVECSRLPPIDRFIRWTHCVWYAARSVLAALMGWAHHPGARYVLERGAHASTARARS